jgi:hypothetical protein
VQKTTFGQAVHSLTLIASQDPNSGHLKTLHSGYLTDLMQAIVKGTVPDRESFRATLGLDPLPKCLVVDCERSLEEMMTAGRYDRRDDITPKNFPITCTGKDEWEFDIVHPNRDISTSEAHKETAKDSDPNNPWMDAKIEHLLIYGEAFPEAQRKFFIVALGSVAKVGDHLLVPYLGRDGSERLLKLRRYDCGWIARYRFLRVRKRTPVPVTTP